MLPSPAPHCNRPPPLPRAWSGHSSETIEAPVAHSEPIADADEKAQHGEGNPVPGEGTQPGGQRVGEDR